MRIVSIGAGNLAHGLIPALAAAGHDVIQVWSRSSKSAKALAQAVNADYTNNLSQLHLDCDLLIICVPDNAIHELPSKIENLASFNGIMVHTSGSTPSFDLENTGVFYPLDSFNKNRKSIFTNIPIFITAKDSKTIKILKALGKTISSRVIKISDEKRRDLHLSAVILNNFIHHLAFQSEEFLKHKGLKFDYLNTLLDTSFQKVKEKRLKNSQTGPARRGDLETIKVHKRMLKDDPELKKLYTLFTESILKTYGHK